MCTANWVSGGPSAHLFAAWTCIRHNGSLWRAKERFGGVRARVLDAEAAGRPFPASAKSTVRHRDVHMRRVLGGQPSAREPARTAVSRGRPTDDEGARGPPLGTVTRTPRAGIPCTARLRNPRRAEAASGI